jgi:vacuolar-type H+-ATPase subunit I/STV1
MATAKRKPVTRLVIQTKAAKTMVRPKGKAWGVSDFLHKGSKMVNMDHVREFERGERGPQKAPNLRAVFGSALRLLFKVQTELSEQKSQLLKIACQLQIAENAKTTAENLLFKEKKEMSELRESFELLQEELRRTEQRLEKADADKNELKKKLDQSEEEKGILTGMLLSAHSNISPRRIVRLFVTVEKLRNEGKEIPPLMDLFLQTCLKVHELHESATGE